MKVDELKNEILAQHNMLRALLVNVGDLASMVAAGDSSREEALRKAAHELASVLQRHMTDEERLLSEMMLAGHLPAAAHLADFQHNHVHQRELLASFDLRVDSVHTTRRLGEFVEALTHAVELDIEHEETAIFGAEPELVVETVAVAVTETPVPAQGLVAEAN